MYQMPVTPKDYVEYLKYVNLVEITELEYYAKLLVVM